MRLCRLLVVAVAVACALGAVSVSHLHAEEADEDENASGSGGPRFADGPGSVFSRFTSHPHRDVFIQLLDAPADQIDATLNAWPKYQTMGEGERGRFREKLERWRDRYRSTALETAQRSGIRLGADRRDEFIREFWRARRRAEEQLWTEIEPRWRELEQAALADLAERFDVQPPALDDEEGWPRVEPIVPDEAPLGSGLR